MTQKQKDRFFDLIEQNYTSIEKYALYLCSNRHVAKDLLSETILLAYDSFDNLKHHEAFLSYIFTICSRTYFKGIKQVKIEVAEQDFDTLIASGLPADDLTDLNIIYQQIQTLDPDEKDVLLLHVLSGLKYKEIAEIKEISLDNVKVKIHRAKQKLIDQLKLNEEANT